MQQPRRMRTAPRLVVAALAAAVAVPAAADPGWDIYLYSGVQTAPHSDVTLRDETGTTSNFTAGWEGRSLEAPPYYGARLVRGDTGPWSFGVEFTHAKIYADDETLADENLGQLELTDGLNILTLNAERELFQQGRWTGRGGLGLGVAVPYVEVTTPGGVTTEEYQFTGPAARWYLGADYALTSRWSLFGEYAGTYSMNSASLDGGGRLETDVITNAVNVGLGFSF